MNTKNKGSNAERQLIKMLWESGYAAVRAAGSGSTRFPSPDVIASNKIRTIAFECKASKNLKKYLTEEEVKQLKEFSNIFGAEPWIGIKYDKLPWYFITTEDLKKTPNGYVISIEIATNKGLLFEELINESII